ncbi:hypothetical protein H4219_006324 [Mycoemilia scoparia]|uniref:Uncharacterized protein n=1 Tax=Mycoemilia scoparia TaxID=417184 RepID=A0A9W7ZID3_9FUNG|nr:hypothetical protein H4219_006324 [Mycoemilia scoparia]
MSAQPQQQQSPEHLPTMIMTAIGESMDIVDQLTTNNQLGRSGNVADDASQPLLVCEQIDVSLNHAAFKAMYQRYTQSVAKAETQKEDFLLSVFDMVQPFLEQSKHKIQVQVTSFIAKRQQAPMTLRGQPGQGQSLGVFDGIVPCDLGHLFRIYESLIQEIHKDVREFTDGSEVIENEHDFASFVCAVNAYTRTTAAIVRIYHVALDLFLAGRVDECSRMIERMLRNRIVKKLTGRQTTAANAAQRSV